jgi:hypothetical protein
LSERAKLRSSVKSGFVFAFLWIAFQPNYGVAQTRYYANAFLDIPLGARAMGLGAAYAAVADDGSAFYWNPAGVSLIHRREVSAMYADQFGGFGQYHFLGYNHQLNEQYSFSVNWIRYSVGDIKEFRELEDNFVDRGRSDYSFDKYYQGTFDYTDNAFFFSFARMNRLRLNLGWLYSDFPVDIPIGVNFKIITGGTNGIAGNGVVEGDVSKFGVGVDVGTMIMFGMSDLLETPGLGDVSFGLTLQDATTTGINWNGPAQDVAPVNFKLGLAYTQPIDEWESNMLFTYERNSRYRILHRYGFEYDYRKLVALRIGYDGYSVSYGTGVSFRHVRIDYALLNQSLGNVHRISVGYKF